MIRVLPLLALVALLAAGSFALGSGIEVDLANRFAAFSRAHPLGTDHLGRDVAERIVAGGAPALTVVALASVLAFVGGLGWASLILLLPRPLGAAAERIAEFVLAVPSLVVGIAVAAVLGLAPVSAALALGLSSTAATALLACELLRTAQRASHVRAAEALGGSATWVLRNHVVPHVAPTLLVAQSYNAARVLLAWSALTFLGVGADTGRADWGSMVWEYRLFLFDHPGLVLAPIAAIFLLAWALARLGDPMLPPDSPSTRHA
jgi:peptide/nickel transport system permease protein